MEHFSGINEAYYKLSVNANKLNTFVELYYNITHGKREYAQDFKLTMMEIHTLTFIEDNPTITNVQLAAMWNKTKSAVSQAVKTLVDNGLVERKLEEGNSKTIHLVATEKGRNLSYVHKAYDIAEITQTKTYLEDKCSRSDIEAFYRVVEEYSKLLQTP